MNAKISVGIVGYGNVGRGVELALRQNPDMQLAAVVTRRDPASLKLATPGVAVVRESEIASLKGKVDVLILCGGSATDLPEQGPRLAALFNTVDSFDTHARIPEYFAAVDAAAKKAGTTAAISIGWDPGLFSTLRLISEAALPDGNSYTFWGKGVSQGHSDAIRRVPGVKQGVQYTIPQEAAIAAVRSGSQPTLTTRQKHLRECFIVAAEGADQSAIEQTIKTMPNYFADYDTVVHFISEAEFKANHQKMPHGGFVFRTGTTGAQGEHTQGIEFALRLDSNPEFTASVLVAYARAVARLSREGQTGAKTCFDIAPGLLSPRSAADLRRDLL